MDRLKKGFAYFLCVFFALVFKEFARCSSHLCWIPALIATVGLVASISWILRLHHRRFFNLFK